MHSWMNCAMPTTRETADESAAETREGSHLAQLRAAFEAHLEETRGEVERLEVFASLDEKVRASTATASPASSRKVSRSWRRSSTTRRWTRADCGRPARRTLRDGSVRDARRVGKIMGHDEAAELLKQTLEEEKAADEKLSALAEDGINQRAAEAAHSEESDEDEDEGEGEDENAVGAGAAKRGASKGRTIRR